MHPMARVLGTVKDMEEYKYQYQKQQQLKHRLIKQVKKTFPKEEIQLLEIDAESVLEIEELEKQIEEKPKKERKKTPREQQMNRPFFNSNYEKFEWLMSNGTTNQEDRKWLVTYMKSDEYINMYGD